MVQSSVTPGAGVVAPESAPPLTGPRPGVRGRRRGQGAQPVVVRTHAFLSPQDGCRRTRRPDLLRDRRDLREPDRALRLRRDRPRQHQPATTGLATPPTLEGWHIFGTDQLGRDYLSRIIYGIRTSLWVALFVAILATVIGTAVGALAGFYGGRTEPTCSCASPISSSRCPAWPSS